MIKCNKYDHITYIIEHGSLNINSMIESFNDKKLSYKDQIKYNGCIFKQYKKKCINFYDSINSYGVPDKIKFKIRLYGRNKWLISQNRNHGSIDDFIIFYKYIKNTKILPNLLKRLQTNRFSLFSSLLPEIINIIINYLKKEKYINNLLLEDNIFLIPSNIRLFDLTNNMMKISFR